MPAIHRGVSVYFHTSSLSFVTTFSEPIVNSFVYRGSMGMDKVGTLDRHLLLGTLIARYMATFREWKAARGSLFAE